MPKCIDVTLNRNCLRFEWVWRLDTSIRHIFGATFQNNPDSPNDQTSRKSIFPFPGGPIKIAKGETVPIKMEHSVTFCLSTPGTGTTRA